MQKELLKIAVEHILLENIVYNAIIPKTIRLANCVHNEKLTCRF